MCILWYSEMYIILISLISEKTFYVATRTTRTQDYNNYYKESSLNLPLNKRGRRWLPSATRESVVQYKSARPRLPIFWFSKQQTLRPPFQSGWAVEENHDVARTELVNKTITRSIRILTKLMFLKCDKCRVGKVTWHLCDSVCDYYQLPAFWFLPT